jgi:Ca2+:H+ antiporter
MLLVFAAAMLAGGMRYPEQRFNPLGARSQATMLLLAAIALILPAAFESVEGTTVMLHRLSISMSVFLLVVYGLYLVFSLITHPELFRSSDAPEKTVPEKEGKPPSVVRALTMLALATVGTAWMSEIMVGSIEPMVHQFGLSDVFVGAFVVAILGHVHI